MTLTLPDLDADQTAALAAQLAPVLVAGDTILLHGDVGAGKTHFARSIIQARLAADGLAEDVPSPTFTLVQTYMAQGCEIWHADLYRLGHQDEIAELGLADAFETAICLIEWPERLGQLAPGRVVELHIGAGHDDDHRSLKFTLKGDWPDLISALESAGANR